VKNGDINIYMVYKNPVSNEKRTSSWEQNKKDPECLMLGEVFVAGDMIGKKTKLKCTLAWRGGKGASLCPGRRGEGGS